MTALPDTATVVAATPSPASVERGGRATRFAWADWARILLASVGRVVLLCLGGSLLWIAVPALFGWTATTVMSNSMAPRFFAGDVIVSMPVTATDLTVGRVVLVDDPDHEGRLRMHRFVAVDADGNLITKGDANPERDSSHVAPNHVRGVAVLRAEFVGLPIVWAQERRWDRILVAGAGLAGLAVLTTIDAPLRRRHGGAEQIRPRTRTGSGLPRLRLALGATGIAALATLVVSTGAHAAFGVTASNTGNSLTAQGTSGDWCSQTAAPDSPYFYYRFSESAGTVAADASGNGRNGTLGSTVTRTSGSCTTSPSPYVTLPGTASTGAITAGGGAVTAPQTYSLEAWFSTTATSEKIIGFGSASTGASSSYDRHVFVDQNGKLVFGVNNFTQRTIVSTAVVNDGAWHHVIAVMDGTSGGAGTGMKLYLDGKSVGTNSNAADSETYSGYWRIGYDNLSNWVGLFNGGQAFAGRLDDVAVYTTALSAAQVTAHYNLGH